jgi:hypothetical protein
VRGELKALPQFVAEIDGLDIHFVHVRSEHPDCVAAHRHARLAGSIIEQLKIIDR